MLCSLNKDVTVVIILNPVAVSSGKCFYDPSFIEEVMKVQKV